MPPKNRGQQRIALFRYNQYKKKWVPFTGAVDEQGIVQVKITDGTNDVNTETRHGRTSLYAVGGFADTQSVHLDTGEVATQTAFMLIDISDTTNWKHKGTDHVIIDHILLQADPDSAYLGEIKVGFLSNVDATDGDFNQMIDLDLAKKSDLIVEDLEFGSHGLHCQSGTHFGIILADSTLFQTDVDLGGPDDPATGTYPSGDGDLVLLVERSAGTVKVSVTIIYETVS